MSKKQNDGGFKIPSDVREFTSLTIKKWKKDYGDPYLSKKEIKKNYYKALVDLLPEVIALLVRYSNRKEVQEITPAIYEKLSDEKFLKTLKKMIESGDIELVDNYEQLPIVIFDFLRQASKWEQKLTAENDGKKVTIDTSDMVEISSMLLKKKIKKATKAGVPENIAFDVFSVIPTSKLLEKSSMYRMRQMFLVLYEHAKSEKITPQMFDTIVKTAVKEEYMPQLSVYLLLERKEMYTQFTEEQKEFFNQVTSWVMNTIEEMPKSEIENILNAYFEARKRDKGQGKDSNRRYFLSSLPAEDFPKITKVLERIQTGDESVKEFM